MDVRITTGSVDSNTFCDFIKRYFLLQLLPLNGSNPRSVVILENATALTMHTQPEN